jgi:Flp pilus assembly protein TadG
VLIRQIKRMCRNRRGNAVIEFALVLPLLLLIVFGITEFGRAIMTTNILHTAAREGARLAAVSDMGDTLSVQTRVVTVMQAAGVDVKSITVDYSAANKSVTVTVTSDFEVLSAGVLDPFMGTIELTGKTVMRYEG